jgi:hypothetical protein
MRKDCGIAQQLNDAKIHDARPSQKSNPTSTKTCGLIKQVKYKHG